MKAKLFLAAILGLLVRAEVNAQITFQKEYGGCDLVRSVAVTSDGGYILCGSTYCPSFNYSSWGFYLIKTNAAGDTLWTKTYAAANNVAFYAIKQHSDGGYVIAQKNFLAKTDANGNLLWAKQYSDLRDFYWWNYDHVTGDYWQETKDNGFVIVGRPDSIAYSGIALLKLDSSGNVQWSKYYEVNYSTYDLVPHSVIQSNDGGFMIGSGEVYWGGNLPNYTGAEVFLKTDSLGNKQWMTPEFLIGGGGCANLMPTSIIQMKNGNYLTVGTDTGTTPTLSMYSSSGTCLWKKAIMLYYPYSNTGYFGHYKLLPYVIREMKYGNYLIAGWALEGNTYISNYSCYAGNTFAILVDSGGNVLNAKIYTNVSKACSAEPTSDGGLIIVGTPKALYYDKTIMIKTNDSLSSGCNEYTPTYSIHSCTFGNGFVIPVVEHSFNAVPPIIVTSNFTSSSGVYSLNTLCGGTPTSASVVPEGKELFTISPNPSAGSFVLEGAIANRNYTLTVINMLGELVVRENVNTPRKTINLANAPKGIYFAFIQGEKGERIQSEKMVVE